MSPVGISLLMLLGMCGFGWLAWRKLAIVVALQPGALGPAGNGCAACCAMASCSNACCSASGARADARGDLPRLHVAAGAQAATAGHRLSVETFVWPDAFGGPFAAFKDGSSKWP
jgi:hypothetical protein